MRVELMLSGRVLHTCAVKDLKDELTIGRSSACHWSVPKDQAKVSSQHAVLTREGDAVRFRDLDSTNGSYLRGERISSHTLLPGEEIRFGDCMLHLSEASSPPAAARPSRLRVRSGPLTGQSFALPREEMTLGSDPAADISIQDPMLSKRHATLLFSPGLGWQIKDLGSTNGTLVAGNRVGQGETWPLGRSGQFHLAHHGFVVEAEGAGTRRMLMVAAGATVAIGLVVAAILLAGMSGGPGEGPDKTPPVTSKTSGRPDPAPPPPPVVFNPLAPDFEALASMLPADRRPEVKPLEEFHQRLQDAAALLAKSDLAGFDDRQKGFAAPPSTTAKELQAAAQALAGRRDDMMLFRRKVEPLTAELLKLGSPIWDSPEIADAIAAADALRARPSGPDALPESGQSAAWLGSLTTFKRLFGLSGKFTFTPLVDSPQPALADAWRTWLTEAQAVAELGDRVGLPAGPMKAQIDLLQSTRKACDQFVRRQLEKALAASSPRTALLHAELAWRLSADPAGLVLAGESLESWLKAKARAVISETEALQDRLDAAAPADRAAARARLLSAGLPGDPMVIRAWREAAEP